MEIKLLRSLIELGDGGAMFKLGTIYLMGEKVPQNLDDASFYLSMAANKNNTSAQCYLGQLYLFGGLGELDYEKAYEWLLKSSESDYTSRYLLGYIFYSGLSHEVDYVEAEKWFSSSTNFTESHFYLGEINYRGLGKEIDYELAAHYYERAAKDGYTPAHYSLGLMHYYGYYYNQNYETAAAGGVVEARKFLGL